MSLTWERLPDEPIIICTFVGNVTVDDQREMYQVSAKILEETGQHLYRVTNYSFVTSTFAEVMTIVREMGTGTPGSVTDPRITAVIIGTHQWTKLALDMVKRPQFGGIQVAAFNAVEDGLTAMRLVIREVTRFRDLGDSWA